MNTKQVIFMHNYLTRYFSDSDDPVSPPGIKNELLLDSAVNRPFMSAGGVDAYDSIFDKAAALFHSLINNHCFHNGNKRVALLSTLVYLSENGYLLNSASDEDLFEFTRQAAAHELSEDRVNELGIISYWLMCNSRRRKNGENQLKFSDLKEILIGFDFEVSDCMGRTHDVIQNGRVVTTILQKGSKGKEDYDKQYVSKLRKKLKLTAEYGVDSYAFYGDRGFDQTLGRFMKMRDKVMRELAKI
ncbi:type II toxin-antitoxin system death-on-curing family toxin [Aeromonas sobria]|uniref:Death-on-curing family protein n=1 Tax=Aeromonas sobria TaxID=646 RepID=A0A1S2CPY9_AERSO|nr:type II toxin-antitoxin system death-on-curing family toxin [Aeromonas sobria]MBS4686314.1 type II toxin-antitoxin system death-on-curing family toxin [Aeromonas sobria]OHY90785.1 death-on-curing family protein [Aeromonas sobria]